MLARLAVLCALSVTTAAAQVIPQPPPSINVNTQSEVKVTPDRAVVRVSVQTRAATAAEAASQNANRHTAVLSALRKLGFPNDQLSTADYSVQPNYRYEPNRDPILSGYIVNNTIVVDVRNVDQVGKVIDASIANGANMISSLDFYAANTDSARHSALSTAVTKARTEATLAARAAGGTLGTLLELNVSSDAPPPPRPMYAARDMAAQAASAPTPINPGLQSVFVSVFTRWQFVPNQ